MIERIIGVFKLDRQTFTEIEHDQSALTEAAIVVAIVAFLAAIGSLFNIFIGDGGAGNVLMAVIGTFLVTFINWIVWSAITYFVGTNLFGGEADLPEMMRVIGYAYAPQMLGIIPCLGTLVGAIWSLVASYFAIKEGLDLDDGKTIATVLIGWLITLLISGILGMIGFGGAISIGALSG
ncbi:MAG: YIP1 family protein [Anaerolineales bacterium]